MHAKRFVVFALCAVAVTAPPSYAIEEFFGIIESRPKTDVGTWVVGGRKVEVTNGTLLEEDNGPFVVGACVELEVDGNVVLEGSTEPKRECRR